MSTIYFLFVYYSLLYRIEIIFIIDIIDFDENIVFFNKKSWTITVQHEMRDQGFEPWTPWLRVRCSASWANRAYLLSQAGDGNRTHVFSLEGWCSTIEPHPHINTNISQSGWQDSNLRPPGPKPGALAKLSHTPKYKFKSRWSDSNR